MLGRAIGKPENVVQPLLQRSMNAPFTLWNNETGFIEAKNADGSWAGESAGFTEGRTFRAAAIYGHLKQDSRRQVGLFV